MSDCDRADGLDDSSADPGGAGQAGGLASGGEPLTNRGIRSPEYITGWGF